MDPILTQVVWFVGGVIVGALVVGAVWYWRHRRGDSYTRHLRRRFGPEYDRAVREHEHRRAAEVALLERERRADGLRLRELSEVEAEAFAARWRALQARFVDEPEHTLAEAQVLVEELMRERGYPTSSYREEIELVSVHHPDAIQHYRQAHELADRHARDRTSTEEQRQALVHYRAMFDELVAVDLSEEHRVPREQGESRQTYH